MIGMSDNDISKKYLEITIPEIERVTCLPVTIWEAITPNILPTQPLKFFSTKPTIETPNSKILSATEMSVWYSHFTLWKHIKDTKINSWVFEHDVDLSKITILPQYEKDIVTLRGKGHLEGYFLTPKGADALYRNAIELPIYYQVDGFVYFLIHCRQSIKEIHYTPNLPINQLTVFGNTIDHRPSFATYQDQE